jgi:predicted CoA-binding protein
MFLFKDIYVIDLECLIIFIVKQHSYSDSELKARFKLKNIAVVGMSKNDGLRLQIDIVNIFRRSHDAPAVIDDALNRKDKVKIIWMQSGIYNENAEVKAKEQGIDVSIT